jgi:hypothetical protein
MRKLDWNFVFVSFFNFSVYYLVLNRGFSRRLYLNLYGSKMLLFAVSFASYGLLPMFSKGVLAVAYSWDL